MPGVALPVHAKSPTVMERSNLTTILARFDPSVGIFISRGRISGQYGR